MKFIPAIDLKDNKCVRLLKGNENKLTVFNENPIEQAKYFEKNGCERIHIVDLDGAFGRENINKDTILNIRKNINIDIELGGGIKNEDNVRFWFEKGINFLILGSLAVKNKNLIINISEQFKEKIYIALDILNKKIMIKGWLEDSNLLVENFIKYFNNSSVHGFVLTDISRDGMLKGLDIKLIKDLVYKTEKKIIVGGGLSSYEDIRGLKKLKCKNLEGVIAGKSYYSGSIEIKQALEIIKSNA